MNYAKKTKPALWTTVTGAKPVAGPTREDAQASRRARSTEKAGKARAEASKRRLERVKRGKSGIGQGFKGLESLESNSARQLADYERENKLKRAGWKRFKPAMATLARRKSRSDLRTRYNARVKEWLLLPENWTCRAGRARDITAHAAQQCHHKHGRGWRGELTMVEELWIPVCQTCHVWIHDNKDAARELNLLAPVGQWNERPKS